MLSWLCLIVCVKVEDLHIHSNFNVFYVLSLGPNQNDERPNVLTCVCQSPTLLQFTFGSTYRKIFALLWNVYLYFSLGSPGDGSQNYPWEDQEEWDTTYKVNKKL